MNISPLMNFSADISGLKNAGSVKKASNIAFYGTKIYDTVSFLGNTQQFKYEDSWYLKDQNVLEQDGFTTTIEDKTVKRSLVDKLSGKIYTKKLYDIALRLREDLVSKNTETVIQNAPHDILDAAELTNEEFVKEINKINAMIALVYPRYDAFEDKTQQSFKMHLGKTEANIKRLAQGLSGVVYTIEVPGCKPLALKHYFNSQRINLSEGPFHEISLAKKMNEDNVLNIPLLYCANPYEGWMLSEFVDKNYETRKDGISVADYVKKHNLVLSDGNSGSFVKGKDRYVFVDFGYIKPSAYDTGLTNFKKAVMEDNISRANSKDYLNSPQNVSTLGVAEKVYMYGNDETKKYFVQRYGNDPEFRLFEDTADATGRVLSNKKIPHSLKLRLQENFEKAGFIGDAMELVKSCDQ